MSRRRSSSRSQRPYYRPSDALGLQFDALVDLIDREGRTLSRRTHNVLRQLSDTLEANIREARGVLAGPSEPTITRELAERVVAAEATVARLQFEANAAYEATPWPWRWFTGVPGPQRAPLQAARSELQASRSAWEREQERQSRQRPAARRPPLDTDSGARAFLVRAEQARAVLHSAMLPSTRQHELDQAQIELNRAKAAAYEGRVRQDADSVKRRLTRGHPCPYCGGPLGTDAQADHIHPVSHGGLSTENNMVYACQPCNGRKYNLTLREFTVKYRLDRAAVERRLESLGKRF